MSDSSFEQKPLVSVLMPAYNGEPYLIEAIESILNQTLTDFELVIIDDGSTDATWSILQEYAAQDRRIVLERNANNLGLIKTLNKGLSLVRGNFIARMDADDISLPERLEAQLNFLEQYPKVGLVGTAYYRMNSRGEYKLRQPPLDYTGLRWQLLFGTPMCHAATMFRRQLYDIGELTYKDFPHIEDYDLYARLFRCTQAANLALPLYVVRVHDTSVCATYPTEQMRTRTLLSMQQINSLLPGSPISPSKAESMYQCYSLQPRLTKDDFAMVDEILRLFDTFSQQSEINLASIHSLRRQWIKRLLANISVHQVRDVLESGMLASLVRHDPSFMLVAGFVHLPLRTLRRVWQRFFDHTAIKATSPVLY